MAKKPDRTVSPEYIRSLRKKGEALRLFTDVSETISSTLDINELMTIVMEKARNIMKAEACSILLYNRETKKLEFEVALCGDAKTTDTLRKKISLDIGQGIAGWVAAKKEMLIIKDVKKDKRFFQEADKLTGFTTRSLIAAPLIGRRGLIGVAEIINPRKKDYDLNVLKILNRHFAIAIENALYHREALDRERLKQEMDIASSLQKSFLPEAPLLRKGRVFVSAVNMPAKQIGGDLYDFIEPSDHAIGIFIGDVSGKGVSAALYMAKITSDFRYIAHKEESPQTVMNRLNTILSKAPRGMFLTALYMIIDTDSGTLNLSCAGHPPFLWLTGGTVKAVSLPSGPPLGIIDEDYPVNTLSLQKGDRLILLTDGVYEAKNRKGARIGFDAIISFAEGHMHDEDLVANLTEYVTAFSKGVERADDLTIVEVRFGQ